MSLVSSWDKWLHSREPDDPRPWQGGQVVLPKLWEAMASPGGRSIQHHPAMPGMTLWWHDNCCIHDYECSKRSLNRLMFEWFWCVSLWKEGKAWWFSGDPNSILLRVLIIVLPGRKPMRKNNENGIAKTWELIVVVEGCRGRDQNRDVLSGHRLFVHVFHFCSYNWNWN